MELKSFDTILIGMCDSFDALIAPKTMSRSNTNIFYLIFKAIAKGYEVINNTCVVLSNKFNPAKCSVEDLLSVSYIVGTRKYEGSASGLRITVLNTSESDHVTLLAGTYSYFLDTDTKFEFEVLADTELAPSESIRYIAMSEAVGVFPVTEQLSIAIESEQEIPSDLVFSCGNNEALLGVPAETNLEFRKRVLSDTERQDNIKELEDELKRLPYLFDCCIKFNNSLLDVTYDGVTIPPFTALISFSGEVKKEIAEKVCSKIICPTVQTEDSVAVSYDSDIFVEGHHIVYITPFKKTEYGVAVHYRINSVYTDAYEVEKTIRTALFNKFVTEIHSDFVKEDDIYNAINDLNLTGIDLLAVNLKYENNIVDYIEVPRTRVPELTELTFVQE